jgi:prepilin-type N-terminal cleavage/methylation domain-containing protein
MKPFCFQLRGRATGGFTLVEVVLASVILSIILLGLHSAMMLAWRASPERDSTNSSTSSAGQALDLLSADLAYAKSINASSATSIEFVVPDRTGDGATDTIRYSWTGTKGDPLLRSINGSDGVAVTTNVAEFQLGFQKRSQLQPTTYAESSEVTLSYYDGVSLLNLGNFVVTNDDFVGQYFKPSVPNGATHWRVTRAQLRVRNRGGTGGLARVQVRVANGNLPGAILDEAPLVESTLGTTYAWCEFQFNNVPKRPASEGLCLVVQWMHDSVACEIEYQSLLAAAANSDMVKTTNGGASWSVPLGQDLRYYVFGTYITPNPTGYTYYLTGVSCTLRRGNDSRAKVQTTIRMFNEPQVSGP